MAKDWFLLTGTVVNLTMLDPVKMKTVFTWRKDQVGKLSTSGMMYLVQIPIITFVKNRYIFKIIFYVSHQSVKTSPWPFDTHLNWPSLLMSLAPIHIKSKFSSILRNQGNTNNMKCHNRPSAVDISILQSFVWPHDLPHSACCDISYCLYFLDFLK
jgi:hypothetical protein